MCTQGQMAWKIYFQIRPDTYYSIFKICTVLPPYPASSQGILGENLVLTNAVNLIYSFLEVNIRNKLLL